MTKITLPNDRPLEDDTQAIVRAMAELNDARIKFSRPTRYQLKIGNLNYYPDRGTIYLDGEAKPEKERGIKSLLDFIQNRLTQKDRLTQNDRYNTLI